MPSANCCTPTGSPTHPDEECNQQDCDFVCGAVNDWNPYGGLIHAYIIFGSATGLGHTEFAV